MYTNFQTENPCYLGLLLSEPFLQIVPQNLNLENETAVGLQFHPSDGILGLGTIKGNILL